MGGTLAGRVAVALVGQLGLRRGDARVLLGVRVLLLGVALGLGRLVDLGDQLLLAQVVVADRDELFLLDDLLLLGVAGLGTGGVGYGLPGVGLLLDLGRTYLPLLIVLRLILHVVVRLFCMI